MPRIHKTHPKTPEAVSGFRAHFVEKSPPGPVGGFAVSFYRGPVPGPVEGFAVRLVRNIIVAPPPPSGGLEGTYAAGNPIPGGLLDEFQTQSGNTISNVNATYSVSNATQYLTSVGDNGSFTFDSNAATVGSHTVDVTVYDYDGLGSDATATVTFSVS